MSDESVAPVRPPRRILLNAPQVELFCSNKISTQKYTIISFLPKYLWEQFRKYNNMYFLVMIILQQLPDVPPNGRWATMVPFLFILLISAVRESIEDMKRYRADMQVNHSCTAVLREASWHQVRWQNLVVGDMIKLVNRERVPADLLVLFTSEPHAMCYIETSNLDGESNLKIRKGVGMPMPFVQSEECLSALRGSIQCEPPNRFLYEFSGAMNLEGVERPIQLDAANMIQRGTTIRNTAWVYGLVVYTGIESKVMLNTVPTPLKRSHVEVTTNNQISSLFGILIVLALFLLVAGEIWHVKNKRKTWYLHESSTNKILQFMTAVLLFESLVPISLQVTLEMVKSMQALLIAWDKEMYYEPTDTPAQARTSNLNEELGQIRYIFSDKTGTLTRNVMEFKALSCAGMKFVSPDMRLSDVLPVDATSGRGSTRELSYISRLMADQSEHATAASSLHALLILLSLCHTVVIDKGPDGKAVYHASSPDEAAIVEGIRMLGYTFTSRTSKTITVRVNEKEETFTLLDVIEFTSARKRMSVIVRNSEGQIKVLCKGADSVIMERLSKEKGANPSSLVSAVERHLEEFASMGLRTLCMAEATMNEAMYLRWKNLCSRAAVDAKTYRRRLAAAANLMERGLTLLGATGIEDKLQEGVPETISSLVKAGIKIWVLTGDKLETAINIGYASRLLSKDMCLIISKSDNFEGVKKVLEKTKVKLQQEQMHNSSACGFGLIIEGEALKIALTPKLLHEFLSVAVSCRGVICCRVSPLQKAEVVMAMKQKYGAVTLAIGDGANDVSMIQAADVGVGINGQEGLQAVCSSDYSIAQFRYLRRLLLVHGMWSYVRVSKVILYSFFKNVCLYLIQLWYSIDSAFSGQVLLDPWAMAFYNVFFTAAPPLALGIFDRLVSAHTLLTYPQIYMTSLKGTLLNGKVFWMTIMNAVLHSLSLYYLTVLLLRHDNASADGTVGDHVYLGNFVFTYTVVSACLKSGLESNNWTIIHHLSIWGNILAFLVFLGVYSLLPFIAVINIYGQGKMIFRNPLFWLGLIIIPGITLSRDVLWKIVRRTFFKTLKDQVDEFREVRQQRMVERAMVEPARKLVLATLAMTQPSTRCTERSKQEAGTVSASTCSKEPTSAKIRSRTFSMIQRMFAPAAVLKFEPTTSMLEVHKTLRGFAFSQDEGGCITQGEYVKICSSREDTNVIV